MCVKCADNIRDDDTDKRVLPPKCCLAPHSRSLLQTSVEPATAAKDNGPKSIPLFPLIPLFGSAPLLSRRSASPQSSQLQAR